MWREIPDRKRLGSGVAPGSSGGPVPELLGGGFTGLVEKLGAGVILAYRLEIPTGWTLAPVFDFSRLCMVSKLH